jgi:hypothetical protein
LVISLQIWQQNMVKMFLIRELCFFLTLSKNIADMTIRS